MAGPRHAPASRRAARAACAASTARPDRRAAARCSAAVPPDRAGHGRARRAGDAARRGRARCHGSAARRDRRASASSSARTGTAISAAAVGVGARRSATKSMSVVSVSCPTAEITGMRQAATARATISSLKAQRSSIEPPPRATISTSSGGIAPSRLSRSKPSMAAAICSAAPSPWTSTGQSRTCLGKRSARRCRMSRMTAPVGEVTMPMRAGRYGIGRLRSSANSPSAASRCLRSSKSAMSAPAPAGSMCSMTSW